MEFDPYRMLIIKSGIHILILFHLHEEPQAVKFLSRNLIS